MSGSPEDFPTLPPIGTAIDGATISVLGADLRPVPTGIKGEIYLGGRCLALGYEGGPTSPPSDSSRSASTARGCTAPVI